MSRVGAVHPPHAVAAAPSAQRDKAASICRSHDYCLHVLRPLDALALPQATGAQDKAERVCYDSWAPFLPARMATPHTPRFLYHAVDFAAAPPRSERPARAAASPSSDRERVGGQSRGQEAAYETLRISKVG